MRNSVTYHSSNKEIVHKQKGNISFLVLSEKIHNKLNLKKVMTYPLVPGLYSIWLPDILKNKTDKSKGVQSIVNDTDDGVIPENSESC